MTLFVAFDTVANQQKTDRYRAYHKKNNILSEIRIKNYEFWVKANFEANQSQASTDQKRSRESMAKYHN